MSSSQRYVLPAFKTGMSLQKYARPVCNEPPKNRPPTCCPRRIDGSNRAVSQLNPSVVGQPVNVHPSSSFGLSNSVIVLNGWVKSPSPSSASGASGGVIASPDELASSVSTPSGSAPRISPALPMRPSSTY